MTEPLDLSSEYTGGDYAYKMEGDGFTIENGKKIIDCSHMVHLLMTRSGYDIPYENTSAMSTSTYYEQITDLTQVKRGDVALWLNATAHAPAPPLNHTGIIETFDGVKNGTFFGAQSSGVATANFGDRPHSRFWPRVTKVLRIKEQYRTGGQPTPAPAPMPLVSSASLLNFQYPFRKADGKQFSKEDEVFKALEEETSGHYLLGSHKFWHGGIHITDKSAPQCVGDEPIRCIADGTVVAYRLNKEYLRSDFLGSVSTDSLRYSNSFCLIRHDYKGPPNTQVAPGTSNELTFYSLYMHLLPFDEYSTEGVTQQKVRAKPSYWEGKVRARVTARGLTLRNAPATLTHGANAGSSKGNGMVLCTNSVVEFDSTKILNLKVNGELLRMAECTFIPSTSNPPTGLKNHDAQVPSSFWACVEDVRPNKLVEWQELTPNTFDVVVPLNRKIKAGDTVGYLGMNETPASPNGGIVRKHQVHLELFSVDQRIDDFIKNKAGVKQGKKYIFLKAGSVLRGKTPESGGLKLTADHVVELNRCPVFDSDWYEVSVEEEGQKFACLIKKADAEIVTQHDWEKLGFRIVKETSLSADGFLDPEDMPDFFKALYTELDSLGNKDNAVTTKDFSEALKNTDFRDHWTKMIAYHPTEWKEKSSSPKWSRLSQLLEGSPEVLKHEKERIDNLVFWDEPALGVCGLGDGNIWHFHPIAMISNFLSKEAAKPGQITYDAEGNDVPTSPSFSRHIHWPGTAPSGVTLGRGYDMGSRSESEIYNHMIAAGLDTVQATKISKAHGLKSTSAQNFVTNNRADIGVITLEQQIALFDLIYPGYVERTINIYNDKTTGLPDRLPWESLSQIVKDILVDFVYQGFTGSERPSVAGMKDDVDNLISYIENTPDLAGHEPNRQRANYLRKYR